MEIPTCRTVDSLIQCSVLMSRVALPSFHYWRVRVYVILKKSRISLQNVSTLTVEKIENKIAHPQSHLKIIKTSRGS
jgi:hypothetical protein